MAVARSKIVNPQISPWYHCISRCVRGTDLLSDERKLWIQQRLEELVGIFAIDVAGFSLTETHFHVLLHLDVKAAKSWTKEEVLRRWAQLYPPRNARRQPLKNLKKWIKEKQSDHQYVNMIRDRLVNLGWFMKTLKEPLARLASPGGGKEGTFWGPRYKSIAVLDKPALLATCIYIDLNPFAAGLVNTPEEAIYTSLFLRVENCRRQGRLDDLKAARGSVALGVTKCRGMEQGLWLCSIEDQREQGAERTGLLDGFSLGNYLLLLDDTSRLARPGKANVNAQADELMDRLGTTREAWEKTLTRMFNRPYPKGVTLAFSRKELREAAQKRGCRHVVNLNGGPARR